MSDSDAVSASINLPMKSPERLAEIERVLARARRGDFSALIPWEEVSAELGLDRLREA